MSLRIESRAQEPFQQLVINWFPKITDDSFLQKACARLVIRIGCYQDRRNRVSCLDEVPVEFDSCHHWHMDVGDQAGRFAESRRCEEIRCRRESLYAMAQRVHQHSHGLAKE